MLMVVGLALGVLLPVSAIVALLVYRRLELEAKGGKRVRTIYACLPSQK